MPPTTPARSSDRPWLKNRRWATGRIRDRSNLFAIFSTSFALLINTLALLTSISVWHDHSQGPALFLVPLFLHLVGLACLYWAVRQIRVRMKFGHSILELETLPGVIGGYLAGTIRVPVLLDTSKGVRLELECLTTFPVYDDNNKRDTREKTLFEGKQTLRPNLPHDASSTQIPVSFAIPQDAPPCGRDGQNTIFWRLRACATQPGPDYDATFLVPVFQLPDPPTSPPKTKSIAAPLRKSQSPVAPTED